MYLFTENGKSFRKYFVKLEYMYTKQVDEDYLCLLSKTEQNDFVNILSRWKT